MYKFIYNGPVVIFDRCVEYVWHGETMAATESKARCNLAYQYKQQSKRAANTVVKLPGKLVKIEGGE